MFEYSGIELIDPFEREKQHILTKELWKNLCERGVKNRDKGRIIGILYSNSKEKALQLTFEFQSTWKAEVFESDEDSLYLVKVKTGVCCLTIEAFLELADILMIDGSTFDLTFSGFEIDLEEVKRLNKPWWKLW